MKDTPENRTAIIKQGYIDSPVFFTKHALGIYVWHKMEEILNSVRDNKYTAVRACHGSSKTLTAACASIWFYNVFPQSLVVSTAPTHTQVELLLWKEINKLYGNANFKLLGNCMNTIIRDPRDKAHIAYGFSTDKPQRAEGFHGWDILFIFDEAKGIPQWMWDSIRGAMGSGNVHLLALSTTDGVAAGEKFYNCFMANGHNLWNKIHIDLYDLPTFTGEKLKGFKMLDSTGLNFLPEEKTIEELRAQISGPEWEKECILEWGKDSVLYNTKCRGEIVDETPDSIIKLSQVRKMFDNYNDPSFDHTGAIEIGADIARFGDDSTELYMRKGMKIIGHKTLNKQSNVAVAESIVDMIYDIPEQYLPEHHTLWRQADRDEFNKSIAIKVDDTGLGGGVTDLLKSWGYNVVPVNFQQQAKAPDKYTNAIGEMWFELKDKIALIACPEDVVLSAQLVNRKKLKLDEKGRRRVEPKDVYKLRFQGKSPDKADAFLLCFYEAKHDDVFWGDHIGPDIRRG